MIDDVILSLTDGYQEDEAGFLGLKIKQKYTKETVTLTQTGLINRILEIIIMMDSNHKYISADKDRLGTYILGPLCSEDWYYR